MVNKVAPYPNDLRVCIKLAGFTFPGVSDKTNIPVSTLYDWATGNRVIPQKERQRLADLLDCDVKLLAPKISSSSLSSTASEVEGKDAPSEDDILVAAPLGSSDFPQAVTQGTIGVSVSKPSGQHGASGLSATDSMQQPTPAGTHQEDVPILLSTEQAELLFSLVRGDDPMVFDPSKRETLRGIAAVVIAGSHISGIEPFAASDLEHWERLLMAQQASSPTRIINAATLEYFQGLLTTCWQLCNENQLATAEGVLVSFLPQLLSLPKQESDTASLTSRGLRLQSIFAHHHLRISNKVQMCEQSVSYARQSGDANTLVTALIELAWAYKYAKQPERCWTPLQQALDQSRPASPLVQARAYSEYAVALAESGRVREAEFYIGLALETFPNDPTKDPGFLFSDSNMFDISYCAGFVCIHAGSMKLAFQAFERYKQHPSGLVIPERHRLIIANGQSQAAILDHDAERYALLLKDVLVGSLHLGSQKRFDEALGIFQKEMPASWLSVSCIKQLVEQYGLKRVEG